METTYSSTKEDTDPREDKTQHDGREAEQRASERASLLCLYFIYTQLNILLASSLRQTKSTIQSLMWDHFLQKHK